MKKSFVLLIESLEKICILSGSRIKTELNPPAKENLYVSTARAHEFRQWLDK